jgi:hypothetical protein
MAILTELKRRFAFTYFEQNSAPSNNRKTSMVEMRRTARKLTGNHQKHRYLQIITDLLLCVHKGSSHLFHRLQITPYFRLICYEYKLIFKNKKKLYWYSVSIDYGSTTKTLFFTLSIYTLLAFLPVPEDIDAGNQLLLLIFKIRLSSYINIGSAILRFHCPDILGITGWLNK